MSNFTSQIFISFSSGLFFFEQLFIALLILKFKFSFSFINSADKFISHWLLVRFFCIAIFAVVKTSVMLPNVNRRHTKAIFALPIKFVIFAFDLNSQILIFFGQKFLENFTIYTLTWNNAIFWVVILGTRLNFSFLRCFIWIINICMLY